MRSVLIIEDDPDMRALERMALESDGYVVSTANDGAEGLRRLTQSRPCVILLDLMMPVMDGLTFLVERRREGLADGVPVICLSAGGEAMLAAARGLGAAECVHKPADFDALSHLVRQYCDRRLVPPPPAETPGH